MSLKLVTIIFFFSIFYCLPQVTLYPTVNCSTSKIYGKDDVY